MEKLEKRMCFFIMFFALLALVGCGEVCDAPVYPNDTARGETEAARVKSSTRFSRNYLSGNLLTVEHDGHLWVIYYGVDFRHSPDCPCKNKDKE